MKNFRIYFLFHGTYDSKPNHTFNTILYDFIAVKWV